MTRWRLALAPVAVVIAATSIIAIFGDRPDGSAIGIEIAALPSASAPPVATPSVEVDLHDAGEAAEVRAALAALGLDHDVRVTDHEAAGADAYVVGAYALVVHPRALLLDVDLATAEAILTGREAPALGDVLGPYELAVSTEAAAWLGRAYPSSNRFVRGGDARAVRALVAEDPSIVGLVPIDALDLSVRALTVEGYDPYRDPDAENPLGDRRWIEGDKDGAIAAALGWDRGGDPLSILGAGEMIPARCVAANAAAHERGYDAIYEGTRALIEAADLAVFSWEPAVVEGDPTPCEQTFNLSTAPESAAAAARAGADVALAIGNHTGDCWAGCAYTDAVTETLAHLRDAGLLTAGAGEDLDAARVPALVEADGVTVAVLGYDEVSALHYGATEDTPGTAPLDLETLAEDVEAAAAEADVVVVGFSWGVEYTSAPTSYQREAARIAVEAGADLVIGNHPHWVQATEARAGAFVAYGLGNFIFDQDWSVETTQGAILEAGFRDGRLVGVRIRPTAVRDSIETVLVPAEGDEGRAILGRMWEAADALD